MDLATLSPLHVALFWTRVQRPDMTACWPWQGYVSPKGYGYCSFGHLGNAQVHVVAFVLLRGPVPVGLTLDHHCHTDDPTCPRGAACLHRRCGNPWHMEPVTREENTRRGRAPDVERNRSREACLAGHLMTEANRCVRKNGRVECRTCNRIRARSSVRRVREAARGN